MECPWTALATKCYNATKHADHPSHGKVSLLDMANAGRLNLLVLRLWLARELGVPLTTLLSRCGGDILGCGHH